MNATTRLVFVAQRAAFSGAPARCLTPNVSIDNIHELHDNVRPTHWRENSRLNASSKFRLQSVRTFEEAFRAF